jgi:hypothetical protein
MAAQSFFVSDVLPLAQLRCSKESEFYGGDRGQCQFRNRVVSVLRDLMDRNSGLGKLNRLIFRGTSFTQLHDDFGVCKFHHP